MANEQPSDDDLLAALQHPLRRRILLAMARKQPISPRELADALDEPLSALSYHVRVLAARKAVKPAGKKRVRGTTQHFYRWAIESAWARKMLAESKEKSEDERSKGRDLRAAPS
jgi:DNA-binding transcriptional ArsR family regulator